MCFPEFLEPSEQIIKLSRGLLQFIAKLDRSVGNLGPTT